jgi:hypothetical protein
MRHLGVVLQDTGEKAQTAANADDGAELTPQTRVDMMI